MNNGVNYTIVSVLPSYITFECPFCHEEVEVDYNDVVNCITYNEENNTYSIWHECQDDYYSDDILEINFCPKCGRKINLNYKNLR